MLVLYITVIDGRGICAMPIYVLLFTNVTLHHQSRAERRNRVEIQETNARIAGEGRTPPATMSQGHGNVPPSPLTLSQKTRQALRPADGAAPQPVEDQEIGSLGS